MKRFRAIVETSKEPEDKEVLWYYKNTLLYYSNGAWRNLLPIVASIIPYNTEEDSNVTTVQEALDKLLYVYPKITSFTLKQAGVYEKGTVFKQLNFSWSYNKSLIKEQKINDISLPLSIREYTSNENIDTDSVYILTASDGTNTISTITSIRFVDYIYFGTLYSNEEYVYKRKINPSIGGFTITAGAKEYLWIFIPKSSGLSKIWHNNVDSTDDFTTTEMTFNTDTGLSVEGTYYVSKNHSLNEVTLKFT